MARGVDDLRKVVRITSETGTLPCGVLQQQCRRLPPAPVEHLINVPGGPQDARTPACPEVSTGMEQEGRVKAPLPGACA